MSALPKPAAPSPRHIRRKAVRRTRLPALDAHQLATLLRSDAHGVLVALDAHQLGDDPAALDLVDNHARSILARTARLREVRRG